MKVVFMIFMILGCFLGAGFVSGREIACYFSAFGKYSYIGIILASVLMFFLIYMFFRLSKTTNTFDSFVCRYFGKSGVVINWLFALCLFILTSSMFAGSLAIAETINVSKIIFALITAVACYFVVIGNIKIIEKISIILVPIIIAVMIWICGFKNFRFDDGDFFLSILSSSNYVFMNIVTLGLFILETGQTYTKKQSIFVALACSIIICVLLILCNNAVIYFDLTQMSMPVLTMSTKKAFLSWIITAITIWIGLFTTIISCVFVLGNFLNKYIKNYKLTIFFILLATLACSNFGFAFLVGYVYWIIGFVGIVLVAKVIIQEKKTQRNFSFGSKDYKNLNQ